MTETMTMIYENVDYDDHDVNNDENDVDDKDKDDHSDKWWLYFINAEYQQHKVQDYTLAINKTSILAEGPQPYMHCALHIAVPSESIKDQFSGERFRDFPPTCVAWDSYTTDIHFKCCPAFWPLSRQFWSIHFCVFRK